MSKIDSRFLNLDAGATEIVNNLTTTTTGKALDAYQGKILNDKIESIMRNSLSINCGEITADN